MMPIGIACADGHIEGDFGNVKAKKSRREINRLFTSEVQFCEASAATESPKHIVNVAWDYYGCKVDTATKCKNINLAYFVWD